jgi:hypothetical protein
MKKVNSWINAHECSKEFDFLKKKIVIATYEL